MGKLAYGCYSGGEEGTAGDFAYTPLQIQEYMQNSLMVVHHMQITNGRGGRTCRAHVGGGTYACENDALLPATTFEHMAVYLLDADSAARGSRCLPAASNTNTHQYTRLRQDSKSLSLPRTTHVKHVLARTHNSTMSRVHGMHSTHSWVNYVPEHISS